MRILIFSLRRPLGSALYQSFGIKVVQTWLGCIVAATVICLLRPPVYSTEIMANGEKYSFDGSYSASLEDSRFGSVEIVRPEHIGDYMVHAEFKKAGKTVLTLRAPDGAETKYDLRIERDKYEITKR